MKGKIILLWIAGLLLACTLILTGCDNEDDPRLTGDETVFTLGPVSDPGISGTVTFAKRDDNATVVTIDLTGTQSGNIHPAHIHDNNSVEGGSIAVDLTAVDGATGRSETVITQLNDGTTITYEELIEFDGHVNVHLSATTLSTLVAQGEIGGNVLTGESEEYPLGPVSIPGISGTVTFAERVNGETLVTIALDGTFDGDSHPSHIHANTAAQGGGIAIDLSNVNGETGVSRTNVTQLNSGTAITYDELVEYNGYVNVHLSSTTLSTLVAQGDIGQNTLTGESVEYTLFPVSNPDISGTVTFEERRNGQTLVTIALDGTVDGDSHPSHIHGNTAAQGGGIMVDLTNVSGATGISRTNVSQLNNGTAITYDELIEYNGYVNVHLSSTVLSTLVAQGDIGQNALTGDVKVYDLGSVSDPDINGTATFAKRNNGSTLVTLNLTGTTAGGDHPAHIHANDAASGGPIVVDFTNVNGQTGRSLTNITQLKDGTPITYEELLVYDGHINVHLSPSELSTLIAQGDIGSNAD